MAINRIVDYYVTVLASEFRQQDQKEGISEDQNSLAATTVSKPVNPMQFRI